tara:strand:+ start:937 stop:1146 length:210 start_codon:yes stop_codon:yes gene_type:complete
MSPSPDGWEEYKIHVLSELKRVNVKLDKIEVDIHKIKLKNEFDRGRAWVVMSLLAIVLSTATTFAVNLI